MVPRLAACAGRACGDAPRRRTPRRRPAATVTPGGCSRAGTTPAARRWRSHCRRPRWCSPARRQCVRRPHSPRWRHNPASTGSPSVRALPPRCAAPASQGVQTPARMDSEGLLALPALAAAGRVGLVTAPEGRGLLAATLAARGVAVDRADVYERVPLQLADAELARLAALPAPACVALSSEQALRLVLAQLPAAAAQVLRQATVAAAKRAPGRIRRRTGLGTDRTCRQPAARGAGPGRRGGTRDQDLNRARLQRRGRQAMLSQRASGVTRHRRRCDRGPRTRTLP